MPRMNCFCLTELSQFTDDLEQRTEEVAPLIERLSLVTPPPGEAWVTQTSTALGTTLKGLRNPSLERLADPPPKLQVSDDELAVIEKAAQTKRILGVDPNSAGVQQQVDLMTGSINNSVPTLRRLAAVAHPIAQKLQAFNRVVQMAVAAQKNLGVNLLLAGNNGGLRNSLQEYASTAAPALAQRLPVTSAGDLQQMGKTARLMNSAKILGADLSKSDGMDRLMRTVDAMQQVQTPDLQMSGDEWATLTGDIATIGAADSSLDTSLMKPGEPVPPESTETVQRNLDRMHDNLTQPPLKQHKEDDAPLPPPADDASELEKTRWQLAVEDDKRRLAGEEEPPSPTGPPQVTGAESATDRYPAPAAAGLSEEESQTIDNCATLGTHMAGALPVLEQNTDRADAAIA